MAKAKASRPGPDPLQKTLLYHFCRLRLPQLAVPFDAFGRHLDRAFQLHQEKTPGENGAASWPEFLDQLYINDWYLCCGCLEGSRQAWEQLFALRASRTDCLLVDALRSRAVDRAGNVEPLQAPVRVRSGAAALR